MWKDKKPVSIGLIDALGEDPGGSNNTYFVHIHFSDKILVYKQYIIMLLEVFKLKIIVKLYKKNYT